MPQGREIFSQLTVEENLRIGLAARRPKLREVPEHIYRDVPGAQADAASPRRRSLRRPAAAAGDRPRAGLDPTLLILDEPTEGIQPNIVHEIGEVIQRLNREAGLTVLLVEQKLPFARRVASELRMLDKGRLVVSGKIDALTDELVHTHLTV